MVQGHRIERKIDAQAFSDLLTSLREDQIRTTGHTFFRLSEGQRKIFKESVIRELIRSQTPVFAGVQYNGNHAVFYKHGKDTVRITMDVTPSLVTIVTFHMIDAERIPRL